MVWLRKAILGILLVLVFTGASHAKTWGPATVASPKVDRKAELDRIFNLLSKAENPVAGALVADQMWLIFMAAPDEQTAEDMNRALRARGGYNFDKALGILGGMIERHPNYAESWNQRSFVHFLKKDYDRSIADCRKALELEPRHIGCMSGMARILIRHQKRFVEGEKLLRQALELHPHIYEKVLLREIPKVDL